ncbi:MAG: class I SAM-dependent methyltransferase, partial [Candidatus Binataceae bacterium]
MIDWNIAAKKTILRLSSIAPAAATRNLRRACDLIDSAHWLRNHSMYPAAASLPDNYQVFELMAREISHRVVLYLEFGVWAGASLRYWSGLLKNPGSMLHGFDSFQGLPEDWRSDHPRGRFARNGDLPQISDERVKIFKGWFNETLPGYKMPPRDVMVVNIDCD